MSFHPQTPQSPSHCSPATSSDPVAGNNTSAAQSTSTAALPTPAHSVNGSNSQIDIAMTDSDSPHKRKRSIDDIGDHRDQKKMHLEDRRLGIEDLHLDVGDKYLLCQSRKTSLCCPLLAPAALVSELDLDSRWVMV